MAEGKESGASIVDAITGVPGAVGGFVKDLATTILTNPASLSDPNNPKSVLSIRRVLDPSFRKREQAGLKQDAKMREELLKMRQFQQVTRSLAGIGGSFGDNPTQEQNLLINKRQRESVAGTPFEHLAPDTSGATRKNIERRDALRESFRGTVDDTFLDNATFGQMEELAESRAKSRLTTNEVLRRKAGSKSGSRMKKTQRERARERVRTTAFTTGVRGLQEQKRQDFIEANMSPPGEFEVLAAEREGRDPVGKPPEKIPPASSFTLSPLEFQRVRRNANKAAKALRGKPKDLKELRASNQAGARAEELVDKGLNAEDAAIAVDIEENGILQAFALVEGISPKEVPQAVAGRVAAAARMQEAGVLPEAKPEDKAAMVVDLVRNAGVDIDVELGTTLAKDRNIFKDDEEVNVFLSVLDNLIGK